MLFFLNNNTNTKAIKSGIWFTVSNFTMKTIGFITTPIFTRLMTKGEYGDFNNIQTWMMILLYVTSLNLEGSLIRASQEHKDDIDNYTYSMFILSSISTIIWFIVINLFINSVSSLMSINRLYLNCMFVYLLFTPIVNLFQNAERFKYHYKWTVVTSLSISIGASLFSVLFVIILPNKLFGRTIGYILPTFIIGIIIFGYYQLKESKLIISYWKYALPIAIPYIPHLLSMYLLNSMDRVMIKNFCGSEVLALYSLAYTCGMLITILVNSVNSAYSPWLAEKLADKNYSAIRRFSFPYVAIFCFLSLGAVLVTPEILYVLGGPTYMDAKYVIPPVAAGCLLQFVYCMYVNIEQYEKKTIGMAFASVTAAIINFILNYLFIPRYGYIAAAYTTYIGYFVLLIMHMMFVKRLGLLHVYSNKKMFFLTIITSICIVSITIILNLTIIRYCILILYLLLLFIVVYKNKEKIKKIVKRG